MSNSRTEKRGNDRQHIGIYLSRRIWRRRMHISCSVIQFHNYRYAGIIGGDGKRTHARTSSKVESGIKCSAVRKYCRDVPPGKTCTFIG